MDHLSFLQTFNAMRIFLELEVDLILLNPYDKTEYDDIATMLTALILCKTQADWQSDPQTFDEAGWIDWMHSVQEVLKKNNILDDAYHVMFTKELAFECMVSYIAYFHVRFSGYEEIGVLLNQVYKVKHQDTDPIWQQWLQAVDHAINDTYLLDAFC